MLSDELKQELKQNRIQNEIVIRFKNTDEKDAGNVEQMVHNKEQRMMAMQQKVIDYVALHDLKYQQFWIANALHVYNVPSKMVETISKMDNIVQIRNPVTNVKILSETSSS